MVLTVDYSQVQEGLKSGEYEIIVSEFKGRTQTKTGRDRFELVLTVRNDINQPGKNALIFVSFMPEFLDQNPWAWNAPSKALGLPNGQTYNSYEDIFNAWVGRPAKIALEVSSREYNGKTYNDQKVKKWEPTQFTNVQHVAKNSQTQPQAPMGQQALQGTGYVQSQVREEDLPFLTDTQPQGGNMNAAF